MKKLSHFLLLALAVNLTAGAQLIPVREDARQLSATTIAQMQANVAQIDPSWAVAAASVAEATPAEKAAFARRRAEQGSLSVSYARPAGVYYAGVSQKTALLRCPSLVAPPFATTTWPNTSANATDDTEWLWRHIIINAAGTDDTLYSADRDLKQYNLVNYNSVPVLSGIVGEDTTTYAFSSKYGTAVYGSKVVAAPSPNSLLSLAGNYGNWYSSSKYFGYNDRGGQYNQAIIHYSVAGDASTSSWFGKNTLGNTNACATAFEKPDHPYLLTKVNCLFANAKFTAPVNLYARVYRIKEIPDSANAVPTVLELVAKGTAELNEDAIVYQSGRWGTLEFDLKMTYDGVDYTVMPEIDYPILVVVGGYNHENITQFNLFVSRDNIDEGLGELGYLCNVDENGDLLNARGFLGNWKTLELHSAPSIFIQTMYTFLKVWKEGSSEDNTEEDLTWNAPAEGGEQTVDFYSYVESDPYWKITTETGEALPSWLTVDCSDRMTGNNGAVYSGHTDVTFTTEALPKDVNSREVKVLFTYMGAKLVYTVKQSRISGIDEVQVSEAEDDANAPVYNMMGQRVGANAKGILIKNGKKIIVR